MVTNCVAYGCNTYFSPITQAQKIQMHTFPFNRPEMLKLWIAAVRRKGWMPTRTSRLCSLHFKDEDYKVRPGGSIRLLKPDAVPSIFNFPKYMQKPATNRRVLVYKTENKINVLRKEFESTSVGDNAQVINITHKKIENMAVKDNAHLPDITQQDVQNKIVIKDNSRIQKNNDIHQTVSTSKQLPVKNNAHMPNKTKQKVQNTMVIKDNSRAVLLLQKRAETQTNNDIHQIVSTSKQLPVKNNAHMPNITKQEVQNTMVIKDNSRAVQLLQKFAETQTNNDIHQTVSTSKQLHNHIGTQTNYDIERIVFQLRRKVKTLCQTVRRRDNTISAMKGLIKELKKNAGSAENITIIVE